MAGRTVSLGTKGGDRMNQYLAGIRHRLSSGALVHVGFLEGATYPLGIKKRVRRKGKVVGRRYKELVGPQEAPLSVAQNAFWQEFGTKNAPPRPAFRRMIRVESPVWGKTMGALLVKTKYDSKRTLGLMGEGIKDQLQTSITKLTDPPLSKKTIAIKGFDKPLIDTATMLRAVDYEVRP